MQGTRQSPPEKGPLGSGHTPKPTPWWMARASPVFAGEPAPTVIADIGAARHNRAPEPAMGAGG